MSTFTSESVKPVSITFSDENEQAKYVIDTKGPHKINFIKILKDEKNDAVLWVLFFNQVSIYSLDKNGIQQKLLREIIIQDFNENLTCMDILITQKGYQLAFGGELGIIYLANIGSDWTQKEIKIGKMHGHFKNITCLKYS